MKHEPISTSHLSAATTPAIAKATIPPNACCVAAAAELAALEVLLAAPALPEEVEEPLPLLDALVVNEPEEEALEDGEVLDGVDSDEGRNDEKEDDEDEKELLGDGEEARDWGVEREETGGTDEEDATALLSDAAAAEGTPGAVETCDSLLVGALVVLAVSPAGLLWVRGPDAPAAGPVVPAAFEGTELGDTVLRERLVVGAPRVTLEASEEAVMSESIWKKGV
ncbi:MAG: hypothetical protein M1822_000093 [Bathelium mastoideum]|nr:MAG: hypothetical protein M1822_000093 [Bathelium mastoideum]